MIRITQFAKSFHLSRATLIYYDKIGLLCPSLRSEGNYRLYSQRDFRRMQTISKFRQAGISLKDIKKILNSKKGATQHILEKRLNDLSHEIQNLRCQQNVIIKLLKNKKLIKHTRALDKKQWVSILKASGLDDIAMKRWHVEFERLSPEAHQDFLESLGIQHKEIKNIRKWAASPSNS